MTPIKELDKKQKLQIIKDIAEGNIDRSLLTDKTLIESKNWFMALLLSHDDSDLDVVLIGEARANCVKFF